MALLEVEDLKVYYPVKNGLFSRKRYLKAVDGVSFSLNEGETLSLVGESGCGKSTLGKALVQLEKPFSGSIRIDGKDLSSLRGKALREAAAAGVQILAMDCDVTPDTMMLRKPVEVCL